MFTCELKEQYVYRWMCFLSKSLILFIRNDAPWHLQRINQDDTLSDNSVDNNERPYTYDSSAGAGVDIYILGKHYFWFGFPLSLNQCHVLMLDTGESNFAPRNCH
jgi:hypothetical protein